MLKKSLVALLLILSFSLVWAAPIPNEYSKYTFPVITTALEDVFEEIRITAKTFNLLPLTKQKGTQLTNNVVDIIIKHYLNKEYLLKRDPIVSLFIGPSLIDPSKRMYYLQVMLSIYETDQVVDGNPIIGDLIIIKYIFVVSESSPKFKA
jgi:small basic protein